MESQLFAILNTLKTANEDMQKGKISYTSYHSLVQRKIKALLVVELTFQAKSLSLDSILQDMDLSEEFMNLIPHIQNSVISYQNASVEPMEHMYSLSELEKSLVKVSEKEKITANFGQYALHPLLLADISSKITSGFITIFDFFKLQLRDIQILYDSFISVENGLKNFPGLENLYLDFKELVRKTKSEIGSTEPNILLNNFETLYRRYLAVLKNPSNL